MRLFIIAALSVSLPMAARAELQICNSTDTPLKLAVIDTFQGSSTLKGWWNIPNYKCQDLGHGSLVGHTIYYHARVVEGGVNKDGFWSGVPYFTFCVRKSNDSMDRPGSERDLRRCPSDWRAVRFYRVGNANLQTPSVKWYVTPGLNRR